MKLHLRVSAWTSFEGFNKGNLSIIPMGSTANRIYRTYVLFIVGLGDPWQWNKKEGSLSVYRVCDSINFQDCAKSDEVITSTFGTCYVLNFFLKNVHRSDNRHIDQIFMRIKFVIHIAIINNAYPTYLQLFFWFPKQVDTRRQRMRYRGFPLNRIGWYSIMSDSCASFECDPFWPFCPSNPASLFSSHCFWSSR